MRAVKCVAGAPAVVDVTRAPGEGVRVKVASAGICGSDLHLLSWNLPAVMGHEFAGALDDGTPVAVEPLAPCGECAACRSGDYQRCISGPAMVFGVARDGGMADECHVPASAVVRLPSGLDARDACLVEPIAVAVHGVRRGRIVGGTRVAVIGGGSIGQCALVAAQAAGANVDLSARHEHQRAVADQLGAGEISGEYEVVLEAAGTADALEQAVELCRPGGSVVLLGTYWDGNVNMPGQTLCMKEVSLVPASMYGRTGASRDIDVAAALLAARPEVAGALITHRFPLDAAAEAFATARDRAAGAIKVVLEP
jgi:threonine dehydrogenase-like Zn-dependent dehydrogenase